MAPMHRPGTTAVLQEQAGFEAVSEQVTALPRAVVPAALPGAGIPVTLGGVPAGHTLPCMEDPDLFFAGALERREPWGVWGGQLFLRGEIVPRKRPRGRPRKDEVAA